MAYSPYHTAELLAEIHTTGGKLEAGDREARRQCLAAARSLVYALEAPLEAILRLNYAEPAQAAAIRTAFDINLFEKLEQHAGNPVTTSKLAESTGTDPELLSRLLKHLAAMGTIFEEDVDMWLPTALSNALIVPMYKDAFPVCDNIIAPVTQKIPEFLAMTKYQNPKIPIHSPLQLAFNTKEHAFAWMAQRPELLAQFHSHMAGTKAGVSSWMDDGYYPFEKNLVKGSKEDTPFFVDVGGSKGHDVQELCRNHPKLERKFVLQDMPEVIKEATELDPRIKAMEHDFFTEQPIKGAKAYFMHRVLHDWPDHKCQEILIQLKAAMIKGYSRLLINEYVIPAHSAHMGITGLDILMMSLAAAGERTEQQWKTLLEGAGFKILKVWSNEPVAESLIEAEIA